MSFSLVFDIVLIGMLAATLAYGFRLNRKLETMRAGRAEFQTLLTHFVEATTQAERSIANLKLTSAESGQNLQEACERATALREDLAFLMEKAGGLADKLESAIGRSRPIMTAAAPVETPPAAAPAPAAGEASAPRLKPRVARRAPEGKKPLSAEDQKLLESLAAVR
jgi:hypothetical protein